MIPVEALTLLAFIPAALALNLTPGADMMFCFAQGLKGGPKAAMAANAGIALGGMVHVLIAGLGLGAAVLALPWLFDVIRWAGVGYLLWLAVATLRHPPGAADVPLVRPSKAFRQALVVNLTNPKVILFVLAFVPQFVVPAQGQILLQFLIFGAVLSVGGLIVNGLVGVFAGGAGRWLVRSDGAAKGLAYVCAAIFAGLAVRLALIERG